MWRLRLVETNEKPSLGADTTESLRRCLRSPVLNKTPQALEALTETMSFKHSASCSRDARNPPVEATKSSNKTTVLQSCHLSKSRDHLEYCNLWSYLSPSRCSRRHRINLVLNQFKQATATGWDETSQEMTYQCTDSWAILVRRESLQPWKVFLRKTDKNQGTKFEEYVEWCALGVKARRRNPI